MAQEDRDRREETPEQRLVLYTPLPVADTPAKLPRLREQTDGV